MEEEILPEDKEVTEVEVVDTECAEGDENNKAQLLAISDRCKNCDTPLHLDQIFCSVCGARRIYNRLNWSNLFEDFADRFLNVENNFLRTFFALFNKPEDVIGGYINGLRKRYLSAFSYFAIALTISGLYVFVFRKWFMTDEMFSQGIDSKSGADIEGFVVAMKKIMNWIFEYQSIFSFINIPFFALVSKLVFWNYKKYNYIEHMVIYLYVYSHTQIITSIVGMLLVWSNMVQIAASSFLTFVYVIYTAFVLLRLFNLTTEKIILKTLLFSTVFTMLGIIVYGVLGVILYFIGVFDPFIEMLKELDVSQKAIKESSKTVRDSLRVDDIKQIPERVKDTVSLLIN